MSSAGSSVLQRALLELTPSRTDWDDLVDLVVERAVRPLALASLELQGVKPIGDPTLVEYAIRAEEVHAEAAIREWHAGIDRPKHGRPKNSFALLRIYAAAFFHIPGQLSDAERARQAAAFLGPPATRDRVEKGARAFLKISAQLIENTVAQGFPREKGLELSAWLVADAWQGLQKIAEEVSADEQRELARRKEARHAKFIGAS